MKNRDFEYKGIKFHLNDNGNRDSSRREFEGKYQLLFWNDHYERWMALGTVKTKKEAQQWVKNLYKHHLYPY